MESPTLDIILTPSPSSDPLMFPIKYTYPVAVLPESESKLIILPLPPVKETTVIPVLFPLLDDDYSDIKSSPIHHYLTEYLHFFYRSTNSVLSSIHRYTRSTFNRNCRIYAQAQIYTVAIYFVATLQYQ